MTKQHGNVSYDNVDQDYLEKRKLRKSAGWVLLWALGVGAVISGDYFGWNFGLAAGGFYSFTRNAFGPGLAYLNGVTDLIEYVITPAVIVVGIGGYLQTLLPSVHPYVWWVLFYAVFVGINIQGAELTLKVGLGITIAAIAVLIIFYLGAIFSGAFSWDKVFNIVPTEGSGGTTFLPFGVYGIFAALPFAIWFYLAIEQIPLAAEEATDVVKDMPKALILGIGTLLVLSIFTLVLNSGVGGGAVEVSTSGAPLDIGFTAVFGSGATTTILVLIGLTGLVASFHTIIYAYGRVLFAQSRAGYIPRWISVTGENTRTPHRALILGAVVGFVIAVIIDRAGDTIVGASLLTMAVFGAVISYALVMISYIQLARTRPELPRPYKSPLGVAGAYVGTVLALISLVATFAIPDNRPGVYGVAFFLVVMYAYYWFYSRHNLVAQAPEEEIALMQSAESELAHK